jgi:sugar diacid utilization regulator/putative methionine-R-sulfoxide reductase with GAF domain
MTARIAQSQIIGAPTRTAVKVQDRDAQRCLEEIGQALTNMSEASLSGEDVVKAVAATSFAAFVGSGSASVLERAGNGWKHADGRTEFDVPMARMLDATISTPAQIVRVEGIGVYVPVNLGSLGVLLRDSVISESHWPALRVLATGFELALAAATQSKGKLDALEAISGLQQIARRILSTRDLDEILFSISHETKRLLSADICGVFLREQDHMVMRDCVGNHTLQIAKVRLRRGQGLAGRVFETGLHCIVNDYLKSEILSQDYAELVRVERIRSALGAPLRVNDELIGVLEVWRRRESTFTETDVRRILALASLTAIAINNARLYDKQKSVVEQLSVANEDLQNQNSVIRQSAEITDTVIQILLAGEGLTPIARIVAGHANARVAFLDCDLQTTAWFPSTSWLEECLPLIKHAVVEKRPDHNRTAVTFQFSERWLSLRPVIAGRDHVGWVCALSDEKLGHLQEIALAQAAMASALYQLEQRAATLARADTLDGIMWDVLEGTTYARQTAVSRAQELQIDLGGPLRIVHFIAERVDETDRSDKFTAGTTERGIKLIREIFERMLSKLGVLRLIGTRGSLIVATVTGKDATQIRQILKTIDDSITREISGLHTIWGVSAPCANASNLHTAHREAASAVLLVGKLGLGRNVAIHEELGVIGLLLKVRGDADLGKFVQEILGKVIAHDSKHHSVLTRTVRAYFDCNCALQAAANKLYVHEKTVRYRLNQFEELTGLDLGHHEERMLVDLALRMYAIAVDVSDANDDIPKVIGTKVGGFLVSSTK